MQLLEEGLNAHHACTNNISGETPMKVFGKLSISLLSTVAALGAVSTALAAAPRGPTTDKNVTVMMFPGTSLLTGRAGALRQAPLRSEQRSLTSYGPAVHVDSQGFGNNPQGGFQGFQGDQDTVPLWTFDVQRAPRDGLNHVGAMVGTNPFKDPGTSRVPVVIVPMVITTQTVATGLNNATFIFSTTSGRVTQNSAAPQSTCLTAPNNVPSTLAYQSPIFQDAPFYFGGVFMGDTQYIDAVQRGSFYRALGDNPGAYHVLFAPVSVLSPIRVTVPANEGLAFSGSMFGGCGTVQILDINWFDSYINGTLLPRLASQGVGPGTVTEFLLYNAVLASPVSDLNTCCILGYHSSAGEPAPNRLYDVSDFDASGIFGPGTENSDVMAHEMGELVNDPFGDNEVPPWGNTGQTVGCQENLEVGDPLSGTNVPPVTMPNGFTYNLQELAFFSWFFGGRSLGVNGWYSSNGTFTSDAGPVCGDPSISSG